MEKIYFATTNRKKLHQAQIVLGEQFEVQGVQIAIPENGISCEENAIRKLNAAIKQLSDTQIIITDDYAIEVEGVSLGDACSEDIVKELELEIGITRSEITHLTFPGVFANRILRYFSEEELLSLILRLSPNRLAKAKVALAIHQTRNGINNVISHTTDLQLQETSTGDGWFWNKISKDSDEIACTSALWAYVKSPRACALQLLAKSLIYLFWLGQFTPDPSCPRQNGINSPFKK